MPELHFVGGEKGGSGKSLFACCFVEYFLELQLLFTLAECDRSNPDVGRTYRDRVDTIFAYFTEDTTRRGKADPLYDRATTCPVIANLPAQVQEAMKTSFLEDNLHEFGHEYGVTFRHWWVTNGGYDSLKLFVQSVQDLGEYMKYVLVLNYGLCDDFSHLDGDQEVQKAIKHYGVPIIGFPKFPYAERNFVEANRLTLSDALTHQGLSVISRQRVKNFLKSAFAEIASVGAFDHE